MIPTSCNWQKKAPPAGRRSPQQDGNKANADWTGPNLKPGHMDVPGGARMTSVQNRLSTL
jgi:hypothetical protein